MPTPKKKRSTARKRKGSVVVRSKAKIVKKGGQTAKNDTIRQVEGRPPVDIAPTFKVKIRRK